MADNKIMAIPEFTKDDAGPVDPVIEEVKETEIESPDIETEIPEEKETPTEPPPTEVEPVENNEDTSEKARAVQGLEHEIVKLRKEISELRGQKRELKQEQLQKVQGQIDELKDVHPEDVAAVERIIRSKGFMTKEEASTMFYNSVKDEKLAQFLEKFPEYKPENDTGDVRWAALQSELAYYRMPDDPRKVYDLLEKAHRSIAPASGTPPSGRTLAVKKEQVKTASVGAGGGQRPSSNIISPDKKRIANLMRSHTQGWSEDEIKKIEQT